MIIEDVIRRAILSGASDIHLVKGQKPVIRVDRELIWLTEFETMDDPRLYDVFEYLTKNNIQLQLAFEKAGKIDLNFEIDNARLRINISKASGSLTVTGRIIKCELPEFDNLGLPQVVKNSALKPQGLILITGKSNTGKTTTLNALVNEINKTENKKILMLEDPIEYMHESNKSLIVQKEVGEGRDCIDFSTGTANTLREDCDIVVVGEVRDRETMDAMLEMAEAGHLVIGTLHTRSCAETLDRMLNFYDQSEQKNVKYMIASVLRAVVSQRLLKGVDGKLVMCAEIMVVDDIIGGYIRKDKLSKTEIEDAILTSQNKGSVSLIFALAELVMHSKITLETAKSQLEAKEYDHLENTIYRMKNGYLNGWKQ